MKTHIRWRKVLKAMGYRKVLNKRKTIVFYEKPYKEKGIVLFKDPTVVYKWRKVKTPGWYKINNKTMVKLINKVIKNKRGGL